MAGIVSYGAYVPYYRLSRGDIFSAWLGQVMPFPGERSVANFDEDSVTMAVAASIDCLTEMDREKIDGVYVATTSSPYQERHCAGIVSQALDIRHDTRAADFSNSLKGGTTAAIAALDAIKAGNAKQILVAAADCRLGGVASGAEMMYGDGAGAIILGDENVIATFEGSHSINEDFMDTWRTDRDKLGRMWEDRWNRESSIGKFVPEAVNAVLAKCNLTLKDIAKVAVFGPFPAMHAAVTRELKLDPGQIQDPLFNTVGNTGTALPLMMLVAALEDAKPGDKIVVASYGSGGCDALLFTVTDQIEKARNRRGIKGHVAIKAMTQYIRMLRWRDLLPLEPGGRAEAGLRFISPQPLWRERKEVLAFHGSKCKSCGTEHRMIERVCVNCQTQDNWEEVCLSERKGKVFSFTKDLLAFSVDPPAVVAMVHFEGGASDLFDVTDRDPNEIKPDLAVEPTFRRLQYTQGIYNYSWKVKPSRE